MNIKSTAIIILTMLIGFVLGVLSTGRFVQSQVSNLHQLREAPMQKLLETIQPTEEQRQQIDPVLEKYASEIKELNLQHKELLQEAIDSLLSEINPVLNPEQLKRIQTRRQKLQEREKQGTLPPPFNPWFMRRSHKKPPPLQTTPPDSLPPLQRFGKNNPAPTAADTALWQQKMQQRKQKLKQKGLSSPPPDSIKAIIWKKRQGETLTAQDSAQLRQFRQQQLQNRLGGNNDSLPPPQPKRFKNHPRPFAPDDSLRPPPRHKQFNRQPPPPPQEDAPPPK